MKRILTITITLAIFTMIGLLKCSAENRTSKKSLHRLIEKSLTFPAGTEVNDKTEVVYVSFSVNEDKKIAIHEINASNKMFSDYVSQKLLSLNLQDVSVEPGKEYVFKMLFKREF